ncbi:MAG: DnaD domain protein [Clostridiales bacterium]|nr:DnaD domain protein [Clostridiales bacterium]
MGTYTFKANVKNMGFTPVPDIFINEYMPQADGNFVKVYLAGLYQSLAGENIIGEKLSKKLGLLESDIIKALEYWESKGLLKIKKNDNDIEINFMDILSIYYGSKIYSSGGKLSPEMIGLRMENPKIKSMHDTIDELLGRLLSPKEVMTYLSWIDDFGFSPEVVILLIEYCKARKKTDFRYIEKVAISWNEAKIKTADDAQRYISMHEEKYNNYRLVLDFLGLKENDLMKPQEEFLNKWFDDWSFSLEMVLEACKICSLRINEPNFSYIDGILSNWHKNGYKTLKDIESKQTNKKGKGIKFKAPVTTFNSYDQRSYDIKELEKKLLGRDEVDGNGQ